MFSQMGKRKYTKKIRAEQQVQTRDRIVQAAMELHEELGPRDTSISAVAERAGVQRLTVYRHFPDDTQLFHACSSQWLTLNPPPDSNQWQQETDPITRTQTALESFFRYYRKTQTMWSGVYRDAKEVPAMDEPLRKFHGYLDGISDDLSAHWQLRTKTQQRLAKSTLHHCLKFSTWQSLDREGISDKQMATLATKWMAGIVN
jgi:AcrR family transcriptional regulator